MSSLLYVIFITFSNCDYELRRLKMNYRRTFSIFITLKHRFLKESNNVKNVFYTFDKIDFLIKLTFFNITRLGLAWLIVS